MRKDNHLIIGKNGEDLASEYLAKNHYRILKRNYRQKWGEIDIVAFDSRTKEIVFVEVKTIFSSNNSLNILPEEELTEFKLNKLKKVILSFLSQYHLDNRKWRFDFIALEIKSQNKVPEIRHYQSVYLEF